jgi:hypothetical protein
MDYKKISKIVIHKVKNKFFKHLKIIPSTGHLPVQDQQTGHREHDRRDQETHERRFNRIPEDQPPHQEEKFFQELLPRCDRQETR